MKNLIKSSIILIDNTLYGVKKYTRKSFAERLKEEGLPCSSTTINRILEFVKEDLGVALSFRRGIIRLVEEESNPKFEYLEKIELYKSFYFRNILQKSVLESQVFSQFISFGFDTINLNLELIQPILNSIIERKKIKIEYQAFYENIPKTYNANPTFLKEYLNRWYLIAETEKTINQVFALDRIKTIEVLNKLFKAKNSQKNQLYKNTIGVNFDGKPQKVILWVSKNQYNYFKTLPIHKSQLFERIAKDGGYIVSLNVVVNYELERWILYYGHHIKVIEPKCLKDTITNELKETLSFYEK